MESNQQNLKETLLKTVEYQNGVLFTVPALVHRQMYSGQNIIAKNLKFEKEYMDERGYLPVELWLLSMQEALNEKSKQYEGLTVIKLINDNSNQSTIFFRDAAKLAEKELFGDYLKSWPLTKILDIGGEPISTTFSDTKEIPPIPPHIHGGEIIDGKAQKPGKIEAYFFPPVSIAPYNKTEQKTISRIGFKPSTTLDDFKEKLSNFGFDDSMYTLLQEYNITPFTGWTIPDGVIHAPGPFITFEIQLPQDDYNFAGWRFGCHCHTKEEQQKMFEQFVLRGLKDKDDFCAQILNWNLSSDPNLDKKFKTEIKIIQEGKWGRQYQIFFHYFYGEGWEVNPNQKIILPQKQNPIGGLVWSGKGFINKHRICNTVDCKQNYEFFVVPNTKIKLINDDSNEKLIIFTVEPFNLKY